MALEYAVIEIWSSENAQWQGRALDRAIIGALKSNAIPARCVVLRGAGGYFETGEEASQNILLLSMHMPVKFEIVLPSAELERALRVIDPLIVDGVVGVREAHVRFHRTPHRLVPAGLLVRDAMTVNPRHVLPESRVPDIVRLLLMAPFHGVPVVDGKHRVVGIITQSDLIQRAGLPLRLGLLAQLDQPELDSQMNVLGQRTARDIMTDSVVTVGDDLPLWDAVALMLDRRLKRLPVLDDAKRLCGMISRLDIFKIVRKTGQVYEALEEHHVDLTQVRSVGDMVQRDHQTVLPDTSVDDVLKAIGEEGVQRIAVVDRSGRFVGMIFDQDLLSLVMDHAPGVWDQVVGWLSFIHAGKRSRELGEVLQARTAGDLMQSDIVTVREDTSIDEAVRLMLEKEFKRLPVVDDDGHYRGMISRDSVLRAGWQG